jgi:hypothetical protein
MLTRAGIAEALKTQLGEIRYVLHHAEDADGMRRARMLIEFAAPLWCAVGEAESVKIIKAEAVTKCRDLVRGDNEFLAGERANSRARSTTERNIRELKDIAATLS